MSCPLLCCHSTVLEPTTIDDFNALWANTSEQLSTQLVDIKHQVMLKAHVQQLPDELTAGEYHVSRFTEEYFDLPNEQGICQNRWIKKVTKEDGSSYWSLKETRTPPFTIHCNNIVSDQLSHCTDVEDVLQRYGATATDLKPFAKFSIDRTTWPHTGAYSDRVESLLDDGFVYVVEGISKILHQQCYADSFVLQHLQSANFVQSTILTYLRRCKPLLYGSLSDVRPQPLAKNSSSNSIEAPHLQLYDVFKSNPELYAAYDSE
jgi:hypothetical protein